MTAQWTPPVTWSAGAIVTKAQFDEQVRDNFEYLFTPGSDLIDYDEGTDKTTTSTAFVAVDTAGGTDLRASVDTYGEDVVIRFTGFVSAVNDGGNSGGVYFNILIDGTINVFGDDGICVLYRSALAATLLNNSDAVSFAVVYSGLAAGTHTFDVTWKVSTAGGTTTATLYAGAATTRLDLRPQLAVTKAG